MPRAALQPELIPAPHEEYKQPLATASQHKPEVTARQQQQEVAAAVELAMAITAATTVVVGTEEAEAAPTSVP